MSRVMSRAMSKAIMIATTEGHRNFSAVIERANVPEHGKTRIPFTLGRFQPFHVGHESLVTNLMTAAAVVGDAPSNSNLPRIILAIGASNEDRDTEKNPFSFEQRAIMAQFAMPWLFLQDIDPKNHPSFLRYTETNPPSFEPLIEQVEAHCTKHGIPTWSLEFFTSVKPGDQRNIVTRVATYRDSHPVAGLARSFGCGFSVCGLEREDNSIISATDLRTDLSSSFHLLQPPVLRYVEKELMLASLNHREVGADNSSDRFKSEEAENALLAVFAEGKMLQLKGAEAEVVTVPESKKDLFASYVSATIHQTKGTTNVSAKVGKKIVMFGVGLVGTTTLQQIIAKGLVSSEDTIVLCDVGERAKGRLDDFYAMCGEAKINPKVEVVDSENSEEMRKISKADIVFVAFSREFSRYGDSKGRSEVVYRNAEVIKSLATAVSKYAPNAVCILDTNPINVIARYFAYASDLPCAQIIGKSSDVETDRLRRVLATAIFENNQKFCKESGYEIPVILETLKKLRASCCFIGIKDAEFMVPLIDPNAIVCGKKISELLTKEQIVAATEEAKKIGIESSRQLRTSSPFYAAARANADILSRIFGRESGESFVSVGVIGDLYQVPSGFEGVPNFLTMPAILGSKGVVSVREIPTVNKESMAKAAQEQDRQFQKLLAMDEIKKISLSFAKEGVGFVISEAKDDLGNSKMTLQFREKASAAQLENFEKLKLAFEKIFKNDGVNVELDSQKINFNCANQEIRKIYLVLDVVKSFLAEEGQRLIESEHPSLVVAPIQGKAQHNVDARGGYEFTK